MSKTLLDVNDGLFDLALRGEIANFCAERPQRALLLFSAGRCLQRKGGDVPHRCPPSGVSPGGGDAGRGALPRYLYERDGAFQVYVNEMFPDGLGAAQLALEQLKARLEKEGLFDPAQKSQLPAYPKM